jgi:23S rRNA (uracil1939-C5)-methyltransferase
VSAAAEGSPCALAGRCGGCPWIGRPLAAQRAAKVEALHAAWRAQDLDPAPLAGLRLRDAGAWGLRDRVDASLRGGPTRLGFWDTDQHDILDVERCPLQGPGLAAAWAALRADPPPLARAGLRLRCGPDGAWGLWIDSANADIGALLDEGAWLRRAAGRFSIELGPRRKALIVPEDPAARPRLGPPALRPWSDAALPGAEPEVVPLWGPVGGFSQPGAAANTALLQAVFALAQRSGARRWLELGAGNGNLSSALLRLGAVVTAVEPDPLAAAGLDRLAADPAWGGRLRRAPGSLDRLLRDRDALFADQDAVLVDPPRSGMGELPAALRAGAGPAWLLAVACGGPAVLAADLAPLLRAGWALVAVDGVDLFPHSPHAEWLALLQRPEGG